MSDGGGAVSAADEAEPRTVENALDVLRSWEWLYGALRRDAPDTEGQIREGAEKSCNRQCSIGYHEECSDRSGINHRGECGCPCHQAEWERVGQFMRWMDETLAALVERDEQWKRLVRRLWVGAVDVNPWMPRRLSDDPPGIFADEDGNALLWDAEVTEGEVVPLATADPAEAGLLAEALGEDQ